MLVGEMSRHEHWGGRRPLAFDLAFISESHSGIEEEGAVAETPDAELDF